MSTPGKRACHGHRVTPKRLDAHAISELTFDTPFASVNLDIHRGLEPFDIQAAIGQRSQLLLAQRQQGVAAGGTTRGDEAGGAGNSAK